MREDRTHPPQELLREDWAFGDLVLVENYVAGRELTCAVMGDKALGVIDIQPADRAVLRLRREVRQGRLDSRPAGRN